MSGNPLLPECTPCGSTVRGPGDAPGAVPNAEQEVLYLALGGILSWCGTLQCTGCQGLFGDSPALPPNGQLEVSVRSLAFWVVHVKSHSHVRAATTEIPIVGSLVQKVPE